MTAVLSLQLILLMGVHFLGDFYGSFYGPILPHLREKLGLSMTLAGGLGALISVTSNFMQPVCGVLGERLGRRRIVAAGMLLVAIGTALLGFAGSLAGVAVALTLGGLGVGMFHPAGATLAGRRGGPRRSSAISLFSVGGSLGVMAAPLVVPWAVGADIRLLAAIAVPGFAFAAIVWRMLPKDETENVAPPAVSGAALARTLADLWETFRKIWPLYLNAVLRAIPASVLGIMLPLYGTLRGESITVANRALALFMLAGAVGMIVAGRLGDRFSEKKLMVASEIIAGVCLVVAPTASGAVFYILLGAGSFFLYSVIPLQISAAQRLAPQAESAASGMVMGLAFGNAALMLLPLGSLADSLKRRLPEAIAVQYILQIAAVSAFLAALVSLKIRTHEAGAGR